MYRHIREDVIRAGRLNPKRLLSISGLARAIV